MSVRLSADEAWEVISSSHTGILTTLRADGSPVTLPVWFVTEDRTICIGAPSRTKKIVRVRRDPRASFLVESGKRWAELQAVHVSGLIEIVTDDAVKDAIAAALDEKYAPFRTARPAMPTATQQHYDDRTFLRLRPSDRILSWANERLGLTE
jgi:PPOX class probable F420-dependent enzyme